MTKLKSIFIGIIVLILFLFIKHQFFHPSANKMRESQSIVVSTFKIKEKKWQPTLQVMGDVKASKSVLLCSEVPGIITGLHFESGQKVKQGQPLVTLRAEDIEADLEKAEAALRDDYKSYQRRKRVPAKYISTSDVDHWKAIVEKDQAEVKRQKALLSKHVITAPFSGVLGIRKIQIGQYITQGQSLVNLEAIDPVYIDFSIPEKWMHHIILGGEVDIKSYAYPNERLTGKMIATSNVIDINNRSLEVRAIVSNEQKKLLSGMAVNVSIKEPYQNKMIVPQSALTYTPDGVGVYRMDNKNTVHWQPVLVGERIEDEAVILSGLLFDDTIVIAGQQKLHDNIQVAVNNQDSLIEQKNK